MLRVATNKKCSNGSLRHATPMFSIGILQSSLIKRYTKTSRLLHLISTSNATSNTQGCCQEKTTNRTIKMHVTRYTLTSRIE